MSEKQNKTCPGFNRAECGVPLGIRNESGYCKKCNELRNWYARNNTNPVKESRSCPGTDGSCGAVLHWRNTTGICSRCYKRLEARRRRGIDVDIVAKSKPVPVETYQAPPARVTVEAKPVAPLNPMIRATLQNRFGLTDSELAGMSHDRAMALINPNGNQTNIDLRNA